MKLTVSQPVTFLAPLETWQFTTVFKTSWLWQLSTDTGIESTLCHPTFGRTILLLLSHLFLDLPRVPFLSHFPLRYYIIFYCSSTWCIFHLAYPPSVDELNKHDSYSIFVNCKWVVTWWQQYSTHLHTNNTQNNTIHICTQTVHRTTQKQYTEQHNNLWEFGPCPVLARFTLAFALQLRKKHG